jgi:hypothetical protein
MESGERKETKVDSQRRETETASIVLAGRHAIINALNCVQEKETCPRQAAGTLKANEGGVTGKRRGLERAGLQRICRFRVAGFVVVRSDATAR